MKIYKLPLLFTISLFLIGCSSKAEQIKEIMTNQQLNGVILVAEKGKIIFQEAYGFADRENNIPNTIITKYPIASLTKQITAASILLLHDESKLNINDPISKYINYPSKKVIKIHHLLSMTSGIPLQYNLDKLPINIDDINGYYEVLNYISSSDIYFTPEDILNAIPVKESNKNGAGNTFEYNNSNYDILGMIIEQVSEQTYGDFLKEVFFKPLEMNSTGTENYYSMNNVAKGYSNYLLSYIENHYNMSIAYASGGIYSTVEDLYKWNIAIDSYILDKTSKNRMYSKQTIINDKIGYGYGWFIEKEKEIVSHNGAIPGFKSRIYKNLKKQQIIIILTNTSLERPLDIITNNIIKVLNS